MQRYVFKTEKSEVRRTWLDSKPEIDAFVSYKITIEVYGEEAGHCFIIPFRKQLNDIFIKPQYRCEGIGSELMKYAISEWDVDNLLCVAMNGMEPIRLQKFYERMGFKVENKELMVRK